MLKHDTFVASILLNFQATYTDVYLMSMMLKLVKVTSAFVNIMHHYHYRSRLSFKHVYFTVE